MESKEFHVSGEHKVGKTLNKLGVDIAHPKFPGVFIETGTNDGAGTDWALSLPDVFHSIFSCEIWEPNFIDLRVHYQATRLAGYSEVPLIAGSDDQLTSVIRKMTTGGTFLEIALLDSRIWLPILLKTRVDAALIWLDAHPGSGVPSELGLPLKDELKALREFSHPDDVVLIDDISHFGTDIDGGCYKDTTREYVFEQLKEIYPDHEIISTIGMEAFFSEAHGYDDYFAVIPPHLVGTFKGND